MLCYDPLESQLKPKVHGALLQPPDWGAVPPDSPVLPPMCKNRTSVTSRHSKKTCGNVTTHVQHNNYLFLHNLHKYLIVTLFAPVEIGMNTVLCTYTLT